MCKNTQESVGRLILALLFSLTNKCELRFEALNNTKPYNPLILPYKFKYSAKCKLDFQLAIHKNMWICFALEMGESLNFMSKK